MDNPVDITANSFAEVSFGGNSQATDTTGGYQKIEVGSAAFQIQLFGFAFSGNKVICQEATRNYLLTLLALLCHDGVGIERELRVTLFKNGIPVSDGYGKAASTGTDSFKAAAFTIETELSNGDILEAMVSNAQGTEKVIVKNLKLTAASI